MKECMSEWKNDKKKGKQSKIKCLFGQNKFSLWDIKKLLQIWLTGSLKSVRYNL